MFDTTVALQQVTFGRGEVSPYLFGRVDLVAYAAGLRTLRNMFVRPEGATSNRPGYAYTATSLTPTSKGSVMIPFVFSATQSYDIEIGNGTAQVISNGALVLNGTTAAVANVVDGFVGPTAYRTITTGAPHGLVTGNSVVISGVTATGTYQCNGHWIVQGIGSPTTFYVLGSGVPAGTYVFGGLVSYVTQFAIPWATGDLTKLRWSQSTDTLTVVHPKYPPYEIKRVSATAFTCLPGTYFGGPFLAQNSDGVTFVYANKKSGTVTLTANANIFNANHVGALFQLTQQDLSQIAPWEPVKPNPTTYARSNLKNYLFTSAVLPGANPATGTIAPAHSQGTQQDGNGQTAYVGSTAVQAGANWQYQDSGFGIVLITQFISAMQVMGIVQSNYPGGPGLLPVAAVGGPQTVVGPFSFSGNGVTTAFTPLVATSSSDSTKFIVTVGGVYQAPSTYTITGIAPGTITFNVPPPVGVNNISVQQISAFQQTSFFAFGAFSPDQGYPSTCTYFPDRLVFAATVGQPVGVFGSKTSDYHNFSVSNPIVASDAFTIFLNARQLNAINDLIPLSDLLIGTSNIIWRLWPGSTGTALSPLAIAANPQSYYGETPLVAAALFGDSAIFAEYDGRRLRDLIYQFAYDKFLGQELTLYSRHLIPFGTAFQRLAYKPDVAAQFLFGLRTDGVMLCCTYQREQQVTGWAHWDTAGTFEDVIVVPETTKFGQYVITNRTINGKQNRFIERLAEREWLTIYDYKFLDCSFTYDGRNTTATTATFSGGVTWLANDIVQINIASAPFLASDVTNQNEIWVYDASGARCRALITLFSSPTTVTAKLRDPCPVDLQNIATATWTFARRYIQGALPLAGSSVVALADSTVYGIGSVDFAANGNLVVGLGGDFTLPFAGGVVNVGLPYLSDFETLALNQQGQETIRMRAKANPLIYLDVAESRNFLGGTDFTQPNMRPSAERAFETYTSSTAVQNGIVWVRVPSTLDSECHTCIRQNMPLPLTIRMHIPEVMIGEGVA